MLGREDRFVGCLLGECLGDALGFPVEGHPPDVCRPYAFESIRTRECLALGRGHFDFGQYSDDSQLTRELFVSYVARAGFDPADYATRIAELFTSRRIVGRGRATTAAAERLAAGEPWHRAGCPPPTAGNGSAMRAAPIGLFFADEAALRAAARDQSRITHQDPRCLAGSTAIAGAVALLCREPPVDVDEFLATLASWVSADDTCLGAALAHDMPRWLARPWEECVPEVAATGRDHDDGWPGISPFVTGAVLWSLYAFLCHPDAPMDAIALAIAPGGDVDTTAAMCGALAGTRNGEQALPADLVARLHDAETWRADELRRLARRAAAVRPASGG